AIFSQMIPPARTLTESMSRVQRGIVASERIGEILHADERVLECQNPQSIKGFRENIVFDKVGFRYENEWVLRDISLTVLPGQSIALVGPSGGGKSTLVDLLPRFYDVAVGDLKIDGTRVDNFVVRD